MTQLTLGEACPDFSFEATSNTQGSLSGLRGRNLVIYFYPKDHTPGCTTEGKDFAALYERFQALDTEIFGVSRDSLRTHENFKTKQGFPFELISDPDEALCRLFDVIKLKKLYGKEHMGIERSTFLIDKTGVLRAQWRKVKVEGHADAVLEAVESL